VAGTLDAALGALGIAGADVVAEGLGTALAAVLAARHPARVHRLLLDGAFVADGHLRTEMKVNYAPDLRPQRDGSHILRCFHLLRDQEAAWPWYDGSAAAVRAIDPRLEPVRMHARLVDTLKQYQSYADPIVAACGVDLAAILPTLAQPVTVCTRDGDARYAAADALAATTLARPDALADRAAAFARALG
jgi:pimeloyl-ACP methyl ester carboxylesterase